MSKYSKELDYLENSILQPVVDFEATEGGPMDIEYVGIGVGYITTPNGCLCRIDIIKKITLVGR